MELGSIKNLIDSNDWNNAFLLILENKSKEEVSKNQQKYNVLLSEIVDEICSNNTSQNDFIESLHQTPKSKEIYKKIVTSFVLHHKFNASFQVILQAIDLFSKEQFFYKHKLDLHSKLDERQKAYETAILFVTNFPDQSYGYLKVIQTLLTLKRTKDALDFFDANKNKLTNVDLLAIYERLNHYESIYKLCSNALIENKNSAFWHSKKLSTLIKLLKPDEEIIECLNSFLNLKELKPKDYCLLIPSAKLNPIIEKRLIQLYYDNTSNLKSVKRIDNYVAVNKSFNSYVNKPSSDFVTPSNSKVDIVYTWVDMSDENFLKKFKASTGAYPDKSDNFQQNQTRYTNNNEIIFSLKTVQTYFDEVNHIYIVTNDQKFDLDFLEPDFQKKITFVPQKDILPTKFVNQTVFDSNLIEAFLWNIEGLSETFIYSCDDYFFGSKIKMIPHIFSKNGIPHAIVAPGKNSNLKFNSALSQYAKKETKFKVFRHNATKDFLKHFNAIPPFEELHVPVILSRQACKEAFEIFAPDWQDNFFKNNLRSNNSVYALQIYLWYALEKGYQIPGPHHLYNQRSFVFAHGLDKENCELLLEVKPIFACVNYLLNDDSKTQFNFIAENYLEIEKQKNEQSKLKSISKAEQNIDLVTRYIDKGDWEAASKILMEEIQIQNFSFNQIKQLILCYSKLENSSQLMQLALAIPSLTIPAEQNKPTLVFMIAQDLIKLKEYGLAKQIKDRNFPSDSMQSYAIESIIFFETQQFEAAKVSIQKLFDHPEFNHGYNAPFFVHNIYNIYSTILLEEKNWDLAITQGKLYVSIYPDAPYYRFLLLRVYEAAHKVNQASELLSEIYPKFGSKHFWIVGKYVKNLQLLGQEEKAITILENELSNHSKAFSLLLNIHLGRGDFDSFMDLSKLPNVKGVNKIELLEGIINTYLSMGYYRVIPAFLQRLIDIETSEIDPIASNCSALNLGNRFYSIINSPVIDTNLILSLDEKNTIKKELNNLNHNFNPRSLTYRLIGRVPDSENDNAFVLNLIRTYLEKMEISNNVWLNTYEDPGHAFKIVETLKNKIKNKIPTSFIRLGDGEGNYLKYPAQFVKHQSADQIDIQAIWWKDSIIKDPKINKEFSDDLQKAISNADIIGTYPDRRLFRVLKTILNHKSVGPSRRGAIAVIDATLNLKGDAQILTSCHIHFDLENWDLYNYLLSDLDSVNLISCHKSLPGYLRERFGINDVNLLEIPTEQKYAKLFGYTEKKQHYPERYQEILDLIKTSSKGDVFLVAAGFLGKMYCNEIKKAGGIAIDIGSIADYWLNFKTRGNDKIPPISNGIKFIHEVGNKIELPAIGKKTKTNHYCNRQLKYEEKNEALQPVNFLITGHPRSGTGFISKLFTAFGFEVGHERLKTEGICSWLHAVSNLNTPFFAYSKIGKYNISRYQMQIENILLVVRHPKNIIPSIILENSMLLSYNYRRYHIFEATGIDLDNFSNSLEKAIVSYLEWIKIIEAQKVVAVIRLEKARQDIAKFCVEKNLLFNEEIDEQNILSRNSTKEKFGIQKPQILPAEYQKLDKELLSKLIQFCSKYGYDTHFLQDA